MRLSAVDLSVDGVFRLFILIISNTAHFFIIHVAVVNRSRRLLILLVITRDEPHVELR